ncbi:MAG: hypothetical protein JST55_00240 [Bacteroidetes bacterium]|nr:hypothetical protein [Bacteroidota bacterium]
MLSILLLCFYVFGITKLGFVYSSHNLFHKISNEQHNDKDCDGSCTIIIDAEKSDKSSDTKSIKISLDNFSSHTYTYFIFAPQIPKHTLAISFISSSPQEIADSPFPPPKI